jgi:H+-translocating NAD(P) transhydrogenase subunit alpha
VLPSDLDILVVFVLAAFLGYEVISKVPSILHTPLMSGSNAIHGVILVGSMIIADEARGGLQIALALAAVILATLNIVGGVVVTDRMLEMFKGRERTTPSETTSAGGGAVGGNGLEVARQGPETRVTTVDRRHHPQ